MERERPFMRHFRAWRDLFGDTRGATAIEYGLILGLVVLVMLVALAELAQTTTGMWNNVSTKVTTAH
jgi:pilus assembly protein Flp/PilA